MSYSPNILKHGIRDARQKITKGFVVTYYVCDVPISTTPTTYFYQVLPLLVAGVLRQFLVKKLFTIDIRHRFSKISLLSYFITRIGPQTRKIKL